jgi:hypothetical protein
MYDESVITQLFGEEALTYLSNKHRGGTSGAKGNIYENFFAVYQLALLSEEALTTPDPTYLSSQVFAFVDDLVINRTGRASPLEHFQLKDSSSVSWGSGLRSIADDFEKQQQLNESLSRPSRLTLIVSNPTLRDRLAASLPNTLIGFSQVQYFPSVASLEMLLSQESTFRIAIVYLCSVEQPDPDKLDCVAKVLLAAWLSCENNNPTVLELLRSARACTPSYIRSFEDIEETDQEFLELLDKIPNFSYNFAKGFFHWQHANELDKGDFPCSTDEESFRRFRERVKQFKPATFEKLEQLMP